MYKIIHSTILFLGKLKTYVITNYNKYKQRAKETIF